MPRTNLIKTVDSVTIGLICEGKKNTHGPVDTSNQVWMAKIGIHPPFLKVTPRDNGDNKKRKRRFLAHQTKEVQENIIKFLSTRTKDEKKLKLQQEIRNTFQLPKYLRE